jgi:hypothetical protein
LAERGSTPDTYPKSYFLNLTHYGDVNSWMNITNILEEMGITGLVPTNFGCPSFTLATRGNVANQIWLTIKKIERTVEWRANSYE